MTKRGIFVSVIAGIFCAGDVFAHGMHATASGAAHGFTHGVMSLGQLLAGIVIAVALWSFYKRGFSREKK